MENKADELASIASNVSTNAQSEINSYNLHILNNHRYDNLTTLIEKAVHRGYSGAEWIDLMGCGTMVKDVAIQWSRKVIKDQQLEDVLESYYNTTTKRLGIVLSRKSLRKYNLVSDSNIFTSLPLELRDWRP